MAAESPRLEAKRRVEYLEIEARSLVGKCVSSRRMNGVWTINPYRGCEFGCCYCYARYAHEFMELRDPVLFETRIFAKRFDATAFRHQLARIPRGEALWIGTATDPYQPAEREFGATRAILEKMAEREGLSLSITTKSNQVVRDIDLLQRISARSSLTVNLSITTLRTRLARLLEPRAPRPDLRLEAVRKLREAGIAAGVFAMPVLPGLTDREEDLDALAKGARDAGAQWFAGRVLFLMPSSWKVFQAFLKPKFPKLAQRYHEWYKGYGDMPKEYRSKMATRFEELRRKYELGVRPNLPLTKSWQSPQLPLAWEMGGERCPA